jgi:hypothetical protein
VLQLNWIQCTGNVWCDLAQLDLKSVGQAAGVYIIWKPGNPPRVVRVGQGNIADRLGAHRSDFAIMQYNSALAPLKVTWAVVSVAQRDGVEKYLADSTNPLVGDAFPVAVPIAVNLP